MKLGDALSQIDTYSGRASENVRALAFAGLAFVWLLAKDLSGVRGGLFCAASILLLALFADFAHYIIAAFTWDRFVRRFEKEHPGEVSLDTPITYDDSLLAPIYGAFYVKVALIILAYGALGYVVVSRLDSAPVNL